MDRASLLDSVDASALYNMQGVLGCRINFLDSTEYSSPSIRYVVQEEYSSPSLSGRIRFETRQHRTFQIINVVGKSSKEAPDFGFIGTPEKHEGEHSRIGNMAMKELGLTNCSKGMDFFRREQGTENWGSYVTGFSVQVFELVPFYGPLPLLYFLYKVSVLGFKPNNIKKIGSIDGYPDAFGNGDIQAAFFVVPHAKAKVILAKYCALFFLFNLGLCFRSRDCGKKARPFHTGQGKRDAKVRIYIFLMNVAKLSHVGSSREILSSKQIVEGWRQHFSVI
ncbi:hypothetical protein V6N13_138964 [Hibiscus sabdariffa]